jgi:hypothetical protein
VNLESIYQVIDAAASIDQVGKDDQEDQIRTDAEKMKPKYVQS